MSLIMGLLARESTPIVGLNNNKSITLFVLTCLFYILAIVFAGLRIYARRLKRIILAADDYMILAALVVYTGQTISTFLQILLGGAGHHVADIKSQNSQMNNKLIIPLSIFYGLGLALIKCSICTLFTRIFIIKPFKIAACAVMGMNIAWGIWSMFGSWVVCTPIAYNWDQSIPGGHCGNRVAASVSIGVIDIFIDFCILLLPIPMVWRLQLPFKNKIGLSLIFCVGIITIVVSCLRTSFYTKDRLDDYTFTAANSFLWTQIGPGISSIVASSLVTRPVFDKIFYQWRLSVPKLRKRSFTLMDDDTYRLEETRDDQQRTEATAFALHRNEIDDHKGGSSLSELLASLALPEPSREPAENEIRVQTGFEVSTSV